MWVGGQYHTPRPLYPRECPINSRNYEANLNWCIKGNVDHRTDHEDPEGELMYSSTLPSTSALDN